MKKVIVVLLVLILIAGTAAGGYVWYRQGHVFLEDSVYDRSATELDLRGRDISLSHFNQLKAQMPNCKIGWDVPFQGRKISSSVLALTVDSLSQQDMEMLAYFPNLKTVDALGMTDYAALENLKKTRPDLEVVYQVSLGGVSVHPAVTGLALEDGDYDYDTLMENLAYLPQVQAISLPKTTVKKSALDALQAAYPDIALTYTVAFRGEELDPDITQLNLSDLKPEEVADAARELAFFPNLEKVELMDASGKSQLSLTDVQTLQEAAPGVQFHYTFTFFRKTLSTLDTQVQYANVYMRDSSEAELRQVLDVMDSCERFVLDNCHFSNEVLAAIREDYRDRTKIVWRVWMGENSSCLTDKEVIKVVGGLFDSNCSALKYCEDVRFMDLGHNDYLTDISYIQYMPKLEAIILSGSMIKDLTPFAGNTSMYFLELSNCTYISDLSPLKDCTGLGMLNISYTPVTSLEPIMHLELDRLKYVDCELNEEDVTAYMEKYPEAWVSDTGHEYGVGWRYEEDGSQSDYYKMLAGRDVFNYPKS